MYWSQKWRISSHQIFHISYLWVFKFKIQLELSLRSILLFKIFISWFLRCLKFVLGGFFKALTNSAIFPENRRCSQAQFLFVLKDFIKEFLKSASTHLIIFLKAAVWTIFCIFLHRGFRRLSEIY